MHKIKVVYIISNVRKSLAFEWIALGLKEKYNIMFLLLNPDDSSLEYFLVREKIPVKRILYRGKRDLINAFVKTFLFLRSENPAVIHAHLLDAQLIGLTAAWLAGIKKRIYTRHNSTYHHAYQPSGIKYDHWSNRFATQIISVSQATDKVMIDMEGVSTEKIVRIPHGFDFNEFQNISDERVTRVRSRWSIPQTGPVIGVIARHIVWKGIQYVLPAFEKFLERFPSACLILANASGPYHAEIVKMTDKIGSGKIIIIPFEDDVAALYRLFDIYVHVPVDEKCEAFGQTYVEALACGVASIFTRSGIADEFIQDRKNALVVDFKNSDAILDALFILMDEPDLKLGLIKIGKRDVISRFGIKTMLDSLKKLYDQ